MKVKVKVSKSECQGAREALEKMQEALGEIKTFFRMVGGITNERFKAYPLGAIEMSLVKESDYLGSSMFPIEELINDIEEDAEEENDDDDDEN